MSETSVKSELLDIAHHILVVEPLITPRNADMTGIDWRSIGTFNPRLEMEAWLHQPLPQGGRILNAVMRIADPDFSASIMIDKSMPDDIFDDDVYVADILEQFRLYPTTEVLIPSRQQTLKIIGSTALSA